MKILDGMPATARIPPFCPCGRRRIPGNCVTVATVLHYGDQARGPIVGVAFHHEGGVRCRWTRPNVHARRWTHALERPS